MKKRTKIFKSEFYRIRELLSFPKYRFQIIVSIVCIFSVRVIKFLFPVLRCFDNLYFRHKQKLLLDRSIQINKSSRTHKEILRVATTYQCNVNCSFCYAQCLREEFKRHMSLDDFEFLVKWAKSQGWKSFRLLGGEPTFHPYFKDILDIARRERLTISISTNGLFDREVNTLLNRDLIESINFSYPQTQRTPEKKDLFCANIKNAISKGIPVVGSWIIYFDDEDGWREIVDLAKRYQNKITLRFSMALPGKREDLSPADLKQNLRKIVKQILNISSYCYQNRVLFFFYRPLLLCMFNKSELDFLYSISPFLFDSQCACFYVDGNYANLVTINPDLTCYPCPVVQVKGMKIASNTTREDISQYFKSSVTELSRKPLVDSCANSDAFNNYKDQLKNKFRNFFDKKICQGGCIGYKMY
ncbi:MAG: radical SAM protein [Candidatus Omnitrophica bacterium]|nr:radical SAM protein [Candidatus Omnitrophota bacterium]